MFSGSGITEQPPFYLPGFSVLCSIPQLKPTQPYLVNAITPPCPPAIPRENSQLEVLSLGQQQQQSPAQGGTGARKNEVEGSPTSLWPDAGSGVPAGDLPPGRVQLCKTSSSIAALVSCSHCNSLYLIEATSQWTNQPAELDALSGGWAV